MKLIDLMPLVIDNLVLKQTSREDIDLILEVLNDRQAYSVFGDSIVTTCIMNIMSSFYGIDYKEKVKPEEWWNNE